MLIHDFGLVGAEKEVHLDDNLILYIIDTLKWVKTFSKLENNIEKNGLNYHGITYFKDEGIKKLKNILFHWKNIFNLGEDVIELEGIFYDSQKKKNSKNKYRKKYIIESLEKLIALCEKAEKENKINRKGEDVSLENFKGKVLLIVNTATRCGFTPQYDELEALYSKYNKDGFEVLDFPCNQFGNQAPESDEEIHTFCQLNYKVKFDQFAKVEVNGENAIPLFKYLKEEKGFAGFDPKHKLTSILNEMLSKNDPDFAKKPDIKWNFTKFLVDKSGNVVARFEPTTSVEVIEQEIKKLLEI